MYERKIYSEANLVCGKCSRMRDIMRLEKQRFGRLTVVKFHTRDRRGTVWLCKCDCGESIFSTSGRLRSGNTRSCGCLRSEMISERMTRWHVENNRSVALRLAEEQEEADRAEAELLTAMTAGD